MTIFDFISSILFNKQKSLTSSIDTENEYSPYLVNRWISMYSPSCAKLANIINRYLVTLTKVEIYNLSMSLFEKVPNKKINYFKKQKEDNKETKTDLIKKIAVSKELSSREIKEYFKLLNYKAE